LLRLTSVVLTACVPGLALIRSTSLSHIGQFSRSYDGTPISVSIHGSGFSPKLIKSVSLLQEIAAESMHDTSRVVSTIIPVPLYEVHSSTLVVALLPASEILLHQHASYFWQVTTHLLSGGYSNMLPFMVVHETPTCSSLNTPVSAAERVQNI
jgi:hypothetical protein